MADFRRLSRGASGAEPLGDDFAEPDSWIESARTHWLPLAALAAALPIFAYALVLSLNWLGAPFPGFFLMNNAVVPTVSAFQWPPDRNAVFHKQVVAVDGVAVHSSRDVQEIVADLPFGQLVTYSLRDRSGESQVQLNVRRFGARDFIETYAILLLFGAAWLFFGIAVAFLQPDRPPTRVFLFQSLIAGLYPICGVFLYQGEQIWLSRFYFLLECLFPATWIHLATVFPVPWKSATARRTTAALAYAIGLALTILVLRGLDAQPANLTYLHHAYLYAGVSFAFFLANLVVQFRRHRDEVIRARVKALLPGATVAGALAFFALTDSALESRSFPVQFGLVFTPLFSACIAYAIAKHDLFDIDRVIRLSFTYTLLSLSVLTGYALIVSLTPDFLAHDWRFVQLVLFVALAFALDPLRRLIQKGVDRAFFREQANYAQTISGLSDALSGLLDVDKIASELTDTVRLTMQLDIAALYIGASREAPAQAWIRDAKGLHRNTPRLDPDEPTAPGDPAEATRTAAREAFGDADMATMIPLAFRGEIVGFLGIGRKLSGRRFSAEDLDLLNTLANQTAIAVRNAQSYAQLEKVTQSLDDQVRRRTNELLASKDELATAYQELQSAQVRLVQSEKMASLGRLVAGVAHELNNPASFVHAGLGNLSRYLERMQAVIEAYEQLPMSKADRGAIDELRDAQGFDYAMRETPSLLRICADGSDRVKKIVDDLRVFARADQGERVETDVKEGVESTLQLLGNRIEQQGVEVITALDGLPAIQANPGQLNQVWINLLGNALDALEGRPTPQLRIAAHVRPNGTGRSWLTVTVADNGEGIPRNNSEKIFEPFFTTKAIGSGTGLGLAIVYGAIKDHGGTIEVGSEVGIGTTFTVRLPLS